MLFGKIVKYTIKYRYKDVERVNEIKFLGVIIDDKIRWKLVKSELSQNFSPGHSQFKGVGLDNFLFIPTPFCSCK